MKRRNLFLIPILTTALSFAGVASAQAASEKPWTFEEIQSYSEELEVLRDEYCKGNPDYMDFPEMCYREFSPAGWDRDLVAAVNMYQDNPIVITALNPGEGTIRVVYSDIDFMRKHHGMDNYEQHFSEIYIYQLDKARLNYDCGYHLWRGEDPGPCQVLYHEKNIENGINGQAAFQEIELPIYEFSLEESDMIDVGLSTFNGGGWGLLYRFGDCLNSPDYKEGMECQARFIPYDLPQYVPVDPKVLTPEPAQEPIQEPEVQDPTDQLDDGAETNPTDGASDTNADTPTSDTVIHCDDVVKLEDDMGCGAYVLDDTIEVASISTTPALTTPDTGSASAPETEGSATEFPTWLAVIIGLSAFTIVWWLSPIKRK